MAKYIGTYPNAAAIETAVENQELNRPYVALAEDTKTVYYGPYVNLSIAGDIIVYDSVRSDLRFIHYENYNTTTYPTATYEPIGVTVKNQNVNEDIKILGLNSMSTTTPNVGKNSDSGANVRFGRSGDEDKGTSTTNGKQNTLEFINLATSQQNWRTDSTITDSYEDGSYPAVCCSWRYCTNGTSQGSWYIPAIDEMELLITNYTSLKQSLTTLGSKLFNRSESEKRYFSSTTNSVRYMKGISVGDSNIAPTKVDMVDKIFQNCALVMYSGQILPM